MRIVEHAGLSWSAVNAAIGLFDDGEWRSPKKVAAVSFALSSVKTHAELDAGSAVPASEAEGDAILWFADPNGTSRGLLKFVASAGQARREAAKNRSLWGIHEDFEPLCNAAWPSAAEFQHTPGFRRSKQANLHCLESMLKRAAHWQYFSTAFEMKMKLTQIVAFDPLNRIGAHQQASMDLPECFRIQTRH